MNLLIGLLLSLAVLVGFPSLPPGATLQEQGFGACVEQQAMIELAVYHVQDKPHVDWYVYNDMDGKPVAILVFVMDILSSEDELVKAYVRKDGKVLEFPDMESLLKVTQSPCDLLPKNVL